MVLAQHEVGNTDHGIIYYNVVTVYVFIQHFSYFSCIGSVIYSFIAIVRDNVHTDKLFIGTTRSDGI